MPSAQFDFPPDPAGNLVDFRYRPLNHPLLLHEEVPDSVEDDLHLRRRLGLVLQHLAAHGRTSIVKGCGGGNQGWRRSPLGGNRGMQFYLWWAPDGSRPTNGVRRSEEHERRQHLGAGGSPSRRPHSTRHRAVTPQTTTPLDRTTSPATTIHSSARRTPRIRPGSSGTTTPSGWCTGIQVPARPPRCGRP